MSENAFFLVPSDPFYVPSEEQRAASLSYFREISPDYEDEYVRLHKHVQFFDSGEYLYAAICPKCDKRLTFYDYPGKAEYEDWWRGLRDREMNQWDQGEQINLENVELTMPCCNQVVRLLDLKFHSPCAFAKFALGQLEPWYTEYWAGDERDFGIGSLLKESTLKYFERLLGCSVIQIWQRR